MLLLNQIPARSTSLDLLKTSATQQALLWRETETPCATVVLPRTWDEYLGMLKPRFRTKVRSVLRNLETRPDARFGFCQHAEELDRLLPALFDLHTRRWADEGKPGVFRGEEKRAFYRLLSRRLLERNWLRFSWLEWRGR